METSGLRLLAEDSDNLGVLAAAVQDALVRPEDIKFDKRARAFGVEINRFQWERAGKRPPYFRSRAILAFSSVEGVRSHAMPRDVDAVLSLLDIRFTPAAEPPGGVITLVFAQSCLIEIAAECVDVTLMDTGPTWPTRRKPDHGKLA
jgi:hypothetical protein